MHGNDVAGRGAPDEVVECGLFGRIHRQWPAVPASASPAPVPGAGAMVPYAAIQADAAVATLDPQVQNVGDLPCGVLVDAAAGKERLVQIQDGTRASHTARPRRLRT